MIKGLLVLTALYFAGELITLYFSLSVPGGVVGMALLTGLLTSGILDVRHVEMTAQLLLDNMGLFFVPAGVGLLVHLELIALHWPAILLITVASLVAVLAAAGISVQALTRGEREHE